MPSVINWAVMETTGCGTALVTPFRVDGSVDEEALRALVNVIGEAPVSGKAKGTAQAEPWIA